jgi:disulfide bond formation protein DsbB
MLGNSRLVNVAGAVLCFALLGYAYYSQFYQGQDPCPLCIFQRVGVFALGVAFVLAALFAPRRLAFARAFALLIGLAALLTIGVAARHLYIQSLPPGSVPVCGATLDYMMDIFPLADVVRKVLTGSGECAKVSWRFLGLAMPAWVLIWSLALGASGVLANWRNTGRAHAA